MSSTAKFQFSDVVIVKGYLVGVIVKTSDELLTVAKIGTRYDVYVRLFDAIREYSERDIKHIDYDLEGH